MKRREFLHQNTVLLGLAPLAGMSRQAEIGSSIGSNKKGGLDQTQEKPLNPYGGETSFCVNSPWRDWVRDVCLDLCRYPVDGIFFDGPCLFAKCCYCSHCQKLYRKTYGKDIPPKEAAHPEIQNLARFQSESLRRFLEHSNSAIKNARPDIFADIQPELLPAPLVSCEIALQNAKAVSPYSVKLKGWDGSEVLPSEYPALALNEYGKGRVFYMAGAFGELFWKYKQLEIRLLLRNLYRLLSLPLIILENAPETVEVVHRQTRDGRVIITLINYSGGPHRPYESLRPLENLGVRVKTSKTQVEALKAGAALSLRRDGDWLTVRIPRLEIFETLVLE